MAHVHSPWSRVVCTGFSWPMFTARDRSRVVRTGFSCINHEKPVHTTRDHGCKHRSVYWATVRKYHKSNLLGPLQRGRSQQPSLGIFPSQLTSAAAQCDLGRIRWICTCRHWSYWTRIPEASLQIGRSCPSQRCTQRRRTWTARQLASPAQTAHSGLVPTQLMCSMRFQYQITWQAVCLCLQYTALGIAGFSPLPSDRQHPSYGDCLQVKGEYYQSCSVLGCVTQCSQSAAHSYEQFLQVQQIRFVTLGPLRRA